VDESVDIDIVIDSHDLCHELLGMFKRVDSGARPEEAKDFVDFHLLC
jgi:hypothetical protein